MKLIHAKFIKHVMAALFIIILFNTGVEAKYRNFGAGIIAGEPSGLSIKNWLRSGRAIDMALAWSFKGKSRFTIHADYLKHRFRLINEEEGSLLFYYGFGGRIMFDDNDERLGMRIPVGLTWLFGKAPFDIFLEIVPILDVIPESDVNLNAAIGFRYYFN